MTKSPVYRIIEEYLQEYVKLRPDYATYLGIPGYDHLMPSMTLKALEEEAELHRELSAKLEKLDDSLLSPSERRDRRLAIMSARLWLLHYEKLKTWEMYPEAPDTANSAIIPLLVRQDSLEDRVHALRSRIEQIPRMLEESKERLRRPVKAWLTAGIAAARSMSGILGLAARMASTLAPEIEDAAAKASDAAAKYAEWLESRLQEAGETPVPGRQVYEEILRLRGIEEGVDELLKLAEEEVKKCRLLLVKALQGSRIPELGEPTPVFPEFSEELDRVLRIIGSRAPSNKEEVFWLYTKFLDEARRFTEKLLGSAERLEVKVLETPKHLWPLIPTAAYVPPTPFRGGEGILYITPPAGNEMLRGHNPYSVCRLILSEIYPGRHLYISWAMKDSSIARKVFQAPEAVEGWLLYSEELARERGFYKEPEHLVLTYLEQLAWAARMRADIKLNAGLAGVEDVAKELAETLGIPAEQALGEVALYPYRPTHQLGPYYGKMAIQRLKRLAAEKLGGKFDEKSFHRALLEEGALPIPLLREALAERLGFQDQC